MDDVAQTSPPLRGPEEVYRWAKHASEALSLALADTEHPQNVDKQVVQVLFRERE